MRLLSRLCASPPSICSLRNHCLAVRVMGSRVPANQAEFVQGARLCFRQLGFFDWLSDPVLTHEVCSHTRSHRLKVTRMDLASLKVAPALDLMSPAAVPGLTGMGRTGSGSNFFEALVFPNGGSSLPPAPSHTNISSPSSMTRRRNPSSITPHCR